MTTPPPAPPTPPAAAAWPPAPPRPRPALPPIPPVDWVRDAAAAVLLLLSLALPWTSVAFPFGLALAATRLDVLLVTIFSALFATITFLIRAGVFGAVRLPTIGLIRLGAAAPYVVLVLVYVVLDAANVTSGLGSAAAVGIAGVVLVAQPRQSEFDADPASAVVGTRRWRVVLLVSLVVIGVVTLLGLVLTIVSSVQARALPLVAIAAILVTLMAAAAAALPLIGLVLGNTSVRVFGFAAGATAVVLALISAAAAHTITPGLELIRSGGYPLIWIALAGALLASPSAGLPVPATGRLQAWFQTAKLALTVVTVAAGALLIVELLTVIALGTSGRTDAGVLGLSITVLVLLAGAGAAAILARVRLLADPANSRMPVLTLSGIAGTLGLVAFILAIVRRSIGTGGASLVDPYLFAVATLVPAGIAIYALLAPAEVRQYYIEHGPAPQAYTAPPTPAAGTGPAAPTGAASPRASDPSATPAELAALAQDPANWIHLAGNPATYPDLLNWLGQVGDESVKQVLRGRGLAV